ncbi:hypothetical protein Z042_02375 [Chania multitudinisentens RB-25]|uniref:GP-PDE domain-containing protein n=1 Tax=Chania multitudinisentens RB-25 TaxID=1441930 RepID=W0LJU6_9GAMM|nr:hypothetical protein [Chania multitudinisentens]AHG22607.1 hypothetical protein Z042_02375 [Chania multitudinisentens RB-25]
MYHSFSVHQRPVYKRIFLSVAIGLLFNTTGHTAPIPAQPFADSALRTDAWGDHFKYGAYSTLIAGHILRTEFPHLLVRLNNQPITDANLPEIKRQVQFYLKRYDSLPDWTIREILEFARNNRSASIFNEERSVILTDEQNQAFISAMRSHPELRPIENLVSNDKFISTNFQFNTHRALYNNAYGIPQNSLAAILCAYAAGIRSIEFDVLETQEEPRGNINVVIHDLSTNRLSGSFNLPPIYAERETYSYIQPTSIDVLNPLAATQSVENSGIKRLMKTADVLNFVRNVIPEVTLYIDARNDSPLSVIEILDNNPQYRDNIVLKIYPFTLDGGAYSIVQKFATRNNLAENTALKRLKEINPHLLLAMGGVAGQASEKAYVAQYSNFNWSTLQSERQYFPFSRTSTLSKNSFNGQTIFTEQQLLDIESKTFNLFKWAMEFPAIGNVLVFQVTLVPSLKSLVDHQTTQGAKDNFRDMPVDDRINSAAIDNFVVLYKRVMGQQLNTTIDLGGSQSTYLRTELAPTVFGFSDRYPDFSLANRDSSGTIIQSSIRNFLYSMEGTVYINDSYAMKKMRSTEAVMEKYQEMKGEGLAVQYATTDLPTDLRAAFMGILGKYGLPKDLQYRASAIIKPRFTPSNLPGFSPPGWTTRMFGDAYKIDPTHFDSDLAAIKTLLNERATVIRSREAIITSRDRGAILTNTKALARLNQTEPVVAADLAPTLVSNALASITTELNTLNNNLDSKRAAFESKYHVPAPTHPDHDYDS